MTKEVAYITGEFGQRYIVFNRAGMKKARSKARKVGKNYRLPEGAKLSPAQKAG